jgi:hypothetical protein
VAVEVFTSALKPTHVSTTVTARGTALNSNGPDSHEAAP